jgi:hypothetical protein
MLWGVELLMLLLVLLLWEYMGPAEGDLTSGESE